MTIEQLKATMQSPRIHDQIVKALQVLFYKPVNGQLVFNKPLQYIYNRNDELLLIFRVVNDRLQIIDRDNNDITDLYHKANSELKLK